MKKRIVIEVSDRFHADIKKKSADRNMTVRSYVIISFIVYIIKEKNERNSC
jgi:hypothetical protein